MAKTDKGDFLSRAGQKTKKATEKLKNIM